MSVTITVSDDGVMRVLTRTAEALERITQPAAELVAEYAREAGGEVTPKLGAEWKITAEGAEIRHVQAPEWWAHFLAGGTRDHGPRAAPALVFTIDGNTIRTGHVRGLAATHFDKKAADRATPRIAELVNRLIEEASA